MSRLIGLFMCLGVLTLLMEETGLSDGAPAPEDRNKSGAYVGGNLSFGQSRAVGESNPGVGYFASGELGYIAARQEWNRMETSLELGTGAGSFKNKKQDVQVTLPISFFALVKFGYGYTVSDHVFGLLKVGAGPAAATYPKKATLDKTSDENLTGFMGLLGYDVAFAAGEASEIVSGFEVRFLSFSGDNIDSFQMNVPSIKLGVRVKL